MLTTKPTRAMLREWRRQFEMHRTNMRPNRKDGAEIDAYFRSKYAPEILEWPAFKEAAEQNILNNEYSRLKLRGKPTEVQTYRVGDVYVAIDRTSGEFHLECQSIDRVIPIYDDLFAFRGLDAEDIQNCFLVAEYVKLTRQSTSV